MIKLFKRIGDDRMYSNSDIATLDKLNFPFDYSGMKYITGKELIERRKSYKGRKKDFANKIDKADRIEYYKLQIELGEKIEFQPNEIKLQSRLMKFVEGYCDITGDEI